MRGQLSWEETGCPATARLRDEGPASLGVRGSHSACPAWGAE